MRWLRFLMLVPLVAVILLLAGAFGQQQAPPRNPTIPPPPSSYKPPQPDKAATDTLAAAIKQLDPIQLGWVETSFRQQANLQGLMFQAAGKYLAAPDRRMRLDLQVRLGTNVGKLEVVSDGTTLWESRQIGPGAPTVMHMAWKKVLEGLQGQPGVEQARDEFFQYQSFMGFVPLLQSIQQRMTISGQEKMTRDGREMTRLTATWKAAPPPEQWPAYLPRQCYIFLTTVGEKKIAWPERLEWWGPDAPGGKELVLLLEMEFRDPKIGQTLPAEQAARLFQVNAGTGEDRTSQMVEGIKARAQQIAAQPRGGQSQR